MEAQLTKEVSVFKFMEDADYFQDLEEDSNITVTSIREEIRDGVKAFIEEPVISSSSPVHPSSPLSSHLASIFSTSRKPVKYKIMSKEERLVLALKDVEEGVKIGTAARKYAVNGQTFRNRLDGKRSFFQFCEEHRFLENHEELSILKFINQWVSLGFLPQLSMIEEKAELFLTNRGEPPNVGKHWTARFLGRHPEYRTKFPRQLGQDRYLNTSPDVFKNWFTKMERGI